MGQNSSLHWIRKGKPCVRQLWLAAPCGSCPQGAGWRPSLLQFCRPKRGNSSTPFNNPGSEAARPLTGNSGAAARSFVYSEVIFVRLRAANGGGAAGGHRPSTGQLLVCTSYFRTSQWAASSPSSGTRCTCQWWTYRSARCEVLPFGQCLSQGSLLCGLLLCCSPASQ